MKYYIGLDMGTNSVGWAVTDTQYHLIRRKGKDLWGVRLFDEANTAADRRTHRISRRRLEREKARIAYVKQIFAPAIDELDPGFFQRLDDSKFYEEDKKEHQPFALFADTGYTDRDYYNEFPTVFHLRAELLTSTEPHDVRLVYLAVLNLFKHRGHFLNPGLKEGNIGNLNELLDQIQELFSEQFDREFPLPEDREQVERILSDRTLNASDKLRKIKQMPDIDKKDKAVVEIWKLICGLKATLCVIFENDSFSEDTKNYGVSFRDGNYEEKLSEIESMLSTESMILFETIKQVYDWSVLASIMKGDGRTYEYISMAKVASYEKHQNDLKKLKRVYRRYLPERYDEMFRVMKDNNYSAYVGSVNSMEEKRRRGGKKSDAFFKIVKKDIEGIEDYTGIEDCMSILHDIDKNTFLPKQRTSDNGVIPNQVYQAELKKILENAENYLPFLKEKDPEYHLTASERILQMFSFHIPYYIGPVKTSENSTGWAVRKKLGRVFPWNLEEKIDVKQTSEKFIENLVRECTYLTDERVLPKNSLLYEKFMVLNELNNLKVHEEKISVELKQDIYCDLFRKSGKRVTNKKLLDYLKQKGVIDADENEDALSGYDKEKNGFTNTLANYHKFMEVFKVSVLTDHQTEMAEDIIFYSTVYGDSRKFLREKIEELYGNELTSKQMDRILGYKFKDWGKLSREFLQMEGADTETGEVMLLIRRMWEENKNLMQLLDANQYTYKTEAENRSRKVEKDLKEITYEDLEDLNLSAPVRRMVWQTIRIVQEIEYAMKEEPERIFVEVTRSEEKEKKRTISRKERLQRLYESCAEEEPYLAAEIQSREESDFRRKKLYLYYLQKGRCMYSGERISFEKLFDDGYYDIDHIYPRHYVKDDSLENNLVLVKAELNREKTDEFPISEKIRSQQAGWWKSLCDGGFISKEKYRRLTRNQPFSEEEKIGFVNRQLVETGQGTKAVAEILTQVFSGRKANDKVVYAKAGNVSEFRSKYKLLKCREVNDFHHANDAYLNIVVGNTYFTRYTRDARNFFRERSQNKTGTGSGDYGMGRMFDFPVQRGGCQAWDPKKDIVTVRKVMAKNTPIVTRKSYVAHGGISDQQIINAEKIRKVGGVGYIPIKSSVVNLTDTQKYGGFQKVSGAYFFLVEHEKKNKKIRSIESMPIYLLKEYSGKEGLETYCRKVLNLKDPNVRWEKIRMSSLLKINGFYVYLVGRSNNRLIICNAVQLCLRSEFTDYIRVIVNAVQKKQDENYLLAELGRNNEIAEVSQKRNVVSPDRNLALYDELVKKHKEGIYSKRVNPVGDKLYNGRDKFKNLSLDKQCYVLYQILRLSRIENDGVDLQDIGGASKTGVSMVNKDISDLKECKLILQSVTGLYSQEIDLLSV